MRICNNCKTEVGEEAFFCPICGARIEAESKEAAAPAAASAENTEEVPVKSLKATLRHERLAWRITAIFFAVSAVVYLISVFTDSAAGSGILDQIPKELLEEETVAALIEAFTEAFPALTVLTNIINAVNAAVICVVSFISAGKIAKYIDRIETDISFATKRTGSVGMLILTALFNGVALIFFIINFVRTKKNRQAIERIAARQGGSSEFPIEGNSTEADFR